MNAAFSPVFNTMRQLHKHTREHLPLLASTHIHSLSTSFELGCMTVLLSNILDIDILHCPKSIFERSISMICFGSMLQYTQNGRLGFGIATMTVLCVFGVLADHLLTRKCQKSSTRTNQIKIKYSEKAAGQTLAKILCISSCSRVDKSHFSCGETCLNARHRMQQCTMCGER